MARIVLPETPRVLHEGVGERIKKLRELFDFEPLLAPRRPKQSSPSLKLKDFAMKDIQIP